MIFLEENDAFLRVFWQDMARRGKTRQDAARLGKKLVCSAVSPQWFVLNTTIAPATVTPWAAEGPEDAYRFRPSSRQVYRL